MVTEDKKFSFKWRVSEGPLVHVCSRRKTVVTRGGRSGQKMKDKKTLWFSSQAASISKNIMWRWQVLQCTREGVNHGQDVQKGFKDFPWEGNSPEDSCMCAVANATADVCDVTAVQLPKRLQPVLWCESNMTLWWKQSVLQSHAGSKANAASAGFFNWSHTEAKGMYNNKRKSEQNTYGFNGFVFPWKRLCWEKLSLDLMNFNFSVR